MRIKMGLLAICLGSAMALTACASEGTSNKEDSSTPTDEESQNKTEQDKSGEDIKKLTEDKAEELMTDFETRLQPRVNEEGKVVEYDTIEELTTYVEETASTDLAKKLVKELYEEKEDGLYVKPDKLGPFLNPDKNYTLNKKSETSYELVQKNETDANGKYTMTITFKANEGTYEIANYQIDKSA